MDEQAVVDAMTLATGRVTAAGKIIAIGGTERSYLEALCQLQSAQVHLLMTLVAVTFENGKTHRNSHDEPA